MDPSQTALPGAVAPPSAEQPSGTSDQPIAGVPSGAPEPTQFAQPAASPDAAALPPLSQGAPVASPPEPDPRLAQFDQLAQRNQQLEAFQQQFQQALQQAQIEQQERDRAQQAQSRLDQARQVARSLAPDEGIDYIDRTYQVELNRERQEKMQIAQMGEQRARQVLEQATAPLYAQHLAATHGLPAEYAQRLTLYGSGHMMDQVLPGLKAEYQSRKADADRIAALQNQIDQFSRSMTAAQYAAGGAHVAPGGGTNPALPQGQQVDWNEPSSFLLEPGVAEFLRG